MSGGIRLESRPARDAAAGMQLGGFTLVRQLGAGGMGQTWEAVRRIGAEFEQRVAIKLAAPEVLAEPYGRGMLCREASLAASLRHPNIAAVLDWNEAGGYIVCELVEGADLRMVMRAAPSDRFPAPLLTYLIEQIARGLSHAHRRVLHGERSPVIHRDMSPGNVVADYDGNLKIVDFGIAKAIRSAHRTSFVQGKLPYMAPEQARGEPLDHSVDQYGLGIVAYEAACGARPHDGATDRETLARILAGEHVPISRRAPDLPSGLADIIERMISVERADRFPNLEAVIDALEPFTPPPNVHRSMSTLVHRARPEETIIEDDHGFVSLPVQLDPPWDASAGQSRSTRASRAPALQVHSWPDFSAASESGTLLGIQEFVYAPALNERDGDGADQQARGDSSSGRTLRSSAVAIAGIAIVLVFGSWILLSAPRSDYLAHAPAPPDPVPSDPAMEDAVSRPPTSQPPGAPLTAATLPPQAIQAAPSTEPTEPSPRRARAIGRARRAAASADSGTVRVRVFPWGRVWVDGEVIGSVPPILELKLPPGVHVVAVGREKPTDSQQVTVVTGEVRTLSFDFEGW